LDHCCLEIACTATYLLAGGRRITFPNAAAIEWTVSLIILLFCAVMPLISVAVFPGKIVPVQCPDEFACRISLVTVASGWPAEA
jgi:hypothetical protein